MQLVLILKCGHLWFALINITLSTSRVTETLWDRDPRYSVLNLKKLIFECTPMVCMPPYVKCTFEGDSLVSQHLHANSFRL